jgi:CRISPR-associated protein (TIGR02710 family)
MPDLDEHVLLVATVGGTAEPIVASLLRWRPGAVRFVCSPETEGHVQDKILPCCANNGLDLPPARWEVVRVPDAQDLADCMSCIRRLDDQIRRWVGLGDGRKVVVDLTGGTKCMSAALALHARRWPCDFSYVGGSQRTKGGVGVVVSGSEQVVRAANPWEALGYQAVEDACAAFDAGAPGLAVEQLEESRKRVDNVCKRELTAVVELMKAYDSWDRFDHAKATEAFQRLPEQRNHLAAVFGPDKADGLLDWARRHLAHLEQIPRDRAIPSRALVLDLLANARRRAAQGRCDDAVARLYRAVEAHAQAALAERGIDSAHVAPEGLPEPLRSEWSLRIRDGQLKLGLQEDYELLEALGDPLGRRFAELGLADPVQSPLVSRNQSILAHGFAPVGQKAYDALWSPALALLEIEPGALPEFPRLDRRS